MARASVSKTRGLEKTRLTMSQPPAVSHHEIVPGKFTDTDWNIMLDKDGSEDFVAGIVDELMDATLDVIYKKYIDCQLLPFTISLAKDEIIEIIEWHFLARDEGEQHFSSDLGWGEDAEPESAETDCWSQGSIPKNFVATTPKILMEIPEVPEEEAVPEVRMVFEEKRPQEPAELQDAVSDTEESPLVSAEHAEPEDKVKNIMTRDVIEHKSQAFFHPKNPSHHIKKSKVADEFEAKKLHDDITESTEKPNSSQKTAHSCSSFIKSIVGRSLGPKDAVFDELGNVIAVAKLDPEKLPSHKVYVKYIVIDPNKESIQVKGDVKKKSTPGFKQKSKMLNVVTEIPNKGSQRKASINTSMAKAAPITMIEEIEVSQGIIVREGGRVKKGPGRYYRKLDILEECQKGMKPVNLRITTPGITVADLLDRKSPILRTPGDSMPLPPIVPHHPHQAKWMS